jgi:thiosulfate/3-mercaptopyruvate sulfurtransferase
MVGESRKSGLIAASPLMTAAELQASMNRRPAPCLLDVRWRLGRSDGHVEYLSGHIPGAIFVDLELELAAPPDPMRGRHPLPDPEALEAAMRRCGVGNDGLVVVYDDWNGRAAARAWWLLRWAGKTDVRVLDGGLQAWIRVGGRLEHGGRTAESGDITVEAGRMPVLDADGAESTAKNGTLLDARAGERYRGDVEPIDPVAGHVPGAICAPTDENLDEEGRFRDPSALCERFAELGVTANRPVGVYCGSGVTAAHEILALAAIGVEAALYAGSWSSWVGDPGRPVATGAAPE